MPYIIYLVQYIRNAAAVLKPAPARDDANVAEEVACVVPWHADGDNVRLSLYRLLQLQDGQVVLKGGRLVVLVDDHPFYLKKRALKERKKERKRGGTQQFKH
jgi:hypothetical protein